MRIAYVSNFSPHHTECYIADALEKKHEVDRYHIPNIRDDFLPKTSRYNLVITSLPCNKPSGFWKQVKAPLVAWYFDWIWGYGGRDKLYTRALKHFDLTLSSDGDTDKRYREAGIRRYYMPMGCDTRFFRPTQLTPRETRDYACDVGFVGHIYTQRRQRLLGRVASKYDFCLWGQDSECYGPIHASICNATKVMIADNFRNDVPGYWSSRVYLEVGSGAFLLHPRVPRLEEHFKDGRHLVMYDSEKDLLDKIGYYLSNEGERQAIADQGWKHVHENHSWDKRVEEFERILCESGLYRTPT